MNQRNTSPKAGVEASTDDRPLTPAEAPPPSGRAAFAGVVGLVIFLPWGVSYGFDVSWYWWGLGVGAWVLGLLVKFPLARLVNRLSMRAVSKATVLGVLSSGTELGMAAVVIIIAGPVMMDSAQVLAFGLAAGWIECIYILGMALLGPRPDPTKVAQWARGARVSWCVRYSLLVERLVAVSGHLGSRGLIWVSLAGGLVWPALVAVVSFSLTDGLAAYGIKRCWNFSDPAVSRAFYSVCAVISLAELVIFLIAWLIAR